MRLIRLSGRPGVASYVVIATFGAALCALVAARLMEEHQMRVEGTRITGVVLGFETLGGSNDFLLYRYDLAGRRYEVRELVSDRLVGRLEPGDPLAIWLRPEQPDRPLIEDRGTAPLWVGLLIGIVCVFGGLFGLVQLPKRRQRRP